MGKRLSFLMMCLLSTLYVLAQGPGGVSGAELWHIATATTSNTDSSYVWRDYSGDTTQFVSTANDQLIIRPWSELQSFNFHPALHFDSISGGSILQHTSMGQTTLIGVFAQPNKDSVELYQTNSNGWLEDSIFMSTQNVYDKSLGSLSHEYLEGNDTLFYQRALKTITYERANLPDRSVWGEPETSSLLFNADCRLFTGYCPEIIVFGRMLSQEERRKVETYLAIKYGITLRGSYFSPKGELIWDKESYQTYHHRVTAIANYTNSSLSQLLSTTSYEEYPRLSVLPSNDSFYKHSTFNKPTSRRLLTLGHEYGYSLPDNTYMIWGDDSQSTTISKLNNDSLWHVMGRTWMLKSNMPSSPDKSTTIDASNIEVSSHSNGSYIINRPRSSSSSTITFGPQTRDDLHLSFICPEHHPSLKITVKGSINRGNYGFIIDSVGSSIRKVLNGIVDSNDTVLQNAKGHRIDFYKKGQCLYLQIDGEGCANNIIELPKFNNPIIPHDSLIFRPDFPIINLEENSSTNGFDNRLDTITIIPFLREDYYNILLNVDKGEQLYVDEFRVDGFCNTGNQLELSYSIAKDLKAFRKNRAIMLIDGAPVFSNPEEVDQKIPSSEIDIDRQKLLFHNIFFNENDTTYFTFAAYDGLIADFTPIRANCDGDDQPTNTGQLIIDIKCGSPLYNLELKPIRENSPMMDSTLIGITPNFDVFNYNFGVNYLVIDSLSPGEYKLKLSQIGGTNIYASPYPSDLRYYSSSVPDSCNVRSVSWFVTDTLSNYEAGFIVGDEPVNTPVNVGFRIDGSKAYPLNDANIYGIATAISPGDSLAVTIYSDGTYLTYNNYTQKVSDNTAFSCFKAKFQRGEATLANVQYTNGTGIPDVFVSDESILVEHVTQDSISKRVYIGYECDTTTRNEVVDIIVQPMNQAPRRTFDDYTDQSNGVNETLANNSALKVTHQGGQDFTAELVSSDTGVAQLLVFDTLGRLIAEGNMTSGAVRTVSFSVPAFGVYIVKVLTDHEEYSEKILCK